MHSFPITLRIPPLLKFETIIATLITFFLGLLAFLAYRHPEGLGRINFILLPLSVLGGGFLIGWDNAITESTLSLEHLFSDGEHEDRPTRNFTG